MLFRSGNLITIEFFIADKITQEQYGKGYFEYAIDRIIEGYEDIVETINLFKFLIDNKDVIGDWRQYL